MSRTIMAKKRSKQFAGWFALVLCSGCASLLRETMPSHARTSQQGCNTAVMTACRNRNSTLPLALGSWLRAAHVVKVVLVDWSSEVPIAQGIPPALLKDPRVTYVRVPGQTRWILSWAMNLASTFVEPELCLAKLDCDTIISKDFFDVHWLQPGRFYAGNYANASNENERHLNGIFYTHAVDFKRIGGYDERIQSYGWDDDDLYKRFVESGLNDRHDFDNTRVEHLFHDDAMRTDSDPTFALYSTMLNMRLADLVQPWDATQAGVHFNVQPGSVSNEVIATLHNDSVVPSNDAMVSQQQLQNASDAVSALLHSWGLDEKIVDPELAQRLAPAYLAKLQSSIEQAGGHPTVILHLQGDLGQRLLALASGIAFAKQYNFWLRVICERDRDFDAALGDLLDLPASGLLDVWDDFSIQELYQSSIEIHDYTQDPSSLPALDVKTLKRFIYIRTAHQLNFTRYSQEKEDDALDSLVPSKAVRQIEGTLSIPKEKAIIAINVHAFGRSLPGSALEDAVVKVHEQLSQLILQYPNPWLFVAGGNPTYTHRLDNGSANPAHYLQRNGCHELHSCTSLEMAEIVVQAQAQVVIACNHSAMMKVVGRLADVDVHFI